MLYHPILYRWFISLVISGSDKLVPDHGVSTRWRHDDSVNEEGHFERRVHSVLHFRDCLSYRLHPQTGLYSQVRAEPLEEVVL